MNIVSPLIVSPNTCLFVRKVVSDLTCGFGFLWQFVSYSVLLLCFGDCTKPPPQHFSGLPLWLPQRSMVTDIYSWCCSSASFSQMWECSRSSILLSFPGPHLTSAHTGSVPFLWYLAVITILSFPKQHRLHSSLWSPCSVASIPLVPWAWPKDIAQGNKTEWKGIPQFFSCLLMLHGPMFLGEFVPQVIMWWPQRKLLFGTLTTLRGILMLPSIVQRVPPLSRHQNIRLPQSPYPLIPFQVSLAFLLFYLCHTPYFWTVLRARMYPFCMVGEF